MADATSGRYFRLTEDHARLARAMWVGWDSCEFGAPAVDCKRPYGNSDVLRDMREILERPDATDDELYQLHGEMQTVLQIALRNGSYSVGEYIAPKYGIDWRFLTSAA